MSRTRNNLELGFAFHKRHRLAIHLNDRRVLASDNQQGWSTNQRGSRTGQIGPASSGYYGLDYIRSLGSSHKRRRRAGASSEQADAVPADLRLNR